MIFSELPNQLLGLVLKEQVAGGNKDIPPSRSASIPGSTSQERETLVSNTDQAVITINEEVPEPVGGVGAGGANFGFGGETGGGGGGFPSLESALMTEENEGSSAFGGADNGGFSQRPIQTSTSQQAAAIWPQVASNIYSQCRIKN